MDYKIKEKLIEFTKTGSKTIPEIMKKFKLTKGQVRYYLKIYNLTYNNISLKNQKLYSKMLEYTNGGSKTINEISDKFGFTNNKARIMVKLLNISYSKYSLANIEISVNVKKDIKLGLTYREVHKKYGVETLGNLYGRGLLSRFYHNILNERDALITEKYEKERAIDIVKSSDKKILRYIEKKRDKHGWSFNDIAIKLNKLGYKTLTGKVFDMPNVYYKYHAYKKNKYKRLKY